MIFKEIIGLYADENGLESIRLTRIFPWSKRVIVKESSRDRGNGVACLASFLQKRRYFPGRKIFLALPRHLFFVRNVDLPSMPVEDAVASISNSMSIYSHLPVEDILFDVYVNRVSKQGLNVLIYYALAKDIIPFLNVFKNTGHERTLRGLFPLSHGVCAWAIVNGCHEQGKEKGGLWIETENFCELAVYNSRGPLKSTIRLKDSSAETEKQMKEELLSEEKQFTINDVAGFLTIDNLKSFCNMPRLAENAGVAALAPSLAGFQDLCVDGTPTRLRLLKPLPLILLVAVCLALLSFFLHTASKENLNSALRANQELQQNINTLEQEITPLSKSRAVLKKAEGFREDVETFMDERPLLNLYINEIARVVPEGTWFAHCSYSPGKITMQGEAVEALKVLESLRGSEVFSGVKLMGSVSRSNVNTERFRVDLQIDKGALKKP